MSDAPDLSGEWTGIYNYPRGTPPVAFTAVLHDAGGLLSGEISEPDHGGAMIGASIDGRREGRAVSFAKLYDRNDGNYDAVAYRGEVSAEGDEIAGTWTIPGMWSGSFIMIRPAKVEAEVAARAEEPVR